MTISKVSFLGASQANVARLKEMNATLTDLQRQMASGKKNETLAGFGVEATNVQRNRTDLGRVQTYLDNIGAVTSRINQMNTAMTAARDAVTQLIDGITTAVRDSAADIPSLKVIAQNALDFVQDLANTQIDGRYLFAGSDSTNAPFSDENTLNANFQQQVTDWLAGTTDTATMNANVTGFGTAQLGLNPGLSASGQVTVRIDTTTELNYTIKADEDGFQDIIKALGFMANMQAPGSGDIPTAADVDEVIQNIMNIARAGVDKLDAAATRIGGGFNLLNAVQENHQQDKATLQGLIGSAENADTTDIVVQIQALQTQLQASYETTSIVNKLSLINYL
ncbi:MAG TPA: flagellin [Patescibacteria group bacterium]|nr:flagellin [Patescibacteria group bacterium]